MASQPGKLRNKHFSQCTRVQGHRLKVAHCSPTPCKVAGATTQAERQLEQDRHTKREEVRMWPCGLTSQGRQDLRCNCTRAFSRCAVLCFWVHEGMHALSGSQFVCLCPLCFSVSQSPPLHLKDADKRVAGSRRDHVPMCTRKWRIYTTLRTLDLQPQDGETASLQHPAHLSPHLTSLPTPAYRVPLT